MSDPFMPMNLEDTIVAISTPSGEGGIGIVRLSGKDAIGIASMMFSPHRKGTPTEFRSHTMHYGHITDPRDGTVIDEVLLSVMKAPHSYTKEDVVEINCHGGMIPLRRVLELAVREGARIAGPGEFTFRAFMNGRIDLSQAEATIDLIRAKTDRARKLAMEQLSGALSEKIASARTTLVEICAHIEAYIDFPEEELDLHTREELSRSADTLAGRLRELSSTYEEARFFREGLSVAIVGRPNVGKSSLLNALVERERAIVTESPGTTRDVIEEYLNINGLPLRIMDTAGIRETHDLAESEGVRRSLRAIDGADLVLAVFDMSLPLKDEDFTVIDKIRTRKSIIVLNKADLPGSVDEGLIPEGLPIVRISARTGQGMDSLKREIEGLVFRSGSSSDGLMITNLRHKLALDGAAEAISRASRAIVEGLPYEITAFELRDALDRLGEIAGETTTEDILNRIFSRFCVGK
ncbi:MAG: tRNA uridine-5-carboxymethylaminomethyl(34) synthesis GTPase MnmE [Deferribacteres bacterium]|nr:tRNA uridine-5-carboxymethylaminomethyl(34) synthesis GTPase MnmE [Deferribacteres bacterium]